MRERKHFFLTYRAPVRESAPRHGLWIPVCFASVVATAVLQVYFLSHFPLFGAPIEWMFVLISLIACRGGMHYGMGFGALGGFLLDSLTGAEIAFLPLVLCLCGALIGQTKGTQTDGFFPVVLTTAVASALLAGYRRITGTVTSFGGTATVFAAALLLALVFTATMPGGVKSRRKQK